MTLDQLDFSLMNELFEEGDSYLEELERLRSSHKQKACLKSARSVEIEREARQRKEPFHVAHPW